MKRDQTRSAVIVKAVVSLALLMLSTLVGIAEIRTSPIGERQFVGQWAGYVGQMDYHFLEIQIRDSWIVRAVAIDDEGRVVEYQVDVDASRSSDGVVKMAMRSRNPRLFGNLEVQLSYGGERLIRYQLREMSSGWSTSGALYNVSAFQARLDVARGRLSGNQRGQAAGKRGAVPHIDSSHGQ